MAVEQAAVAPRAADRRFEPAFTPPRGCMSPFIIIAALHAVLRGARGYAAQGDDVWRPHAYAHGLGERPEHIDQDADKLDGALKAQYDALPAAEQAKYGYDRMLRACLVSLVTQCDRRAAQTATRLRGRTR